MVAGLVATPLAVGFTAAPAQAVSAGLVISEVYGGGGNASATYNQDFVELHNPTASPISVASMSVQYRSASGAANPSGVVPLSGSVAPGGRYLVALATGATGAALPVTPNATATGVNLSGTSGTVFLANQTGVLTSPPTGSVLNNAAIVDLVGYGTSNTFETTAASSPSDNTQSLTRTGVDTDVNASDFAGAAASPQTGGGGSSALAATDPGDKSFVVNQAIAPFQLAATGGTPPVTWTSTALPAGLTLAANGTISGTPTATGTTTVTATATDGATPTAGTSQTTFDITVTASQVIRTIAEIQGTDVATSPLSGEVVTTEGVVTAKYAAASGNFNGTYIQTAGTGGATDATPGASDAVFVFGANSVPAGVEIGESVRVTGTVSEFSGSTQITPSSGGITEIASLGSVTPAAIAYPTTEAGREAHEGELLAPTGPFTVSNVYSVTGGASAFAEIGLATGTKPLQQPTDLVDAQTGDTAAVVADNAARGVALDDGASANYMTASNQSLPLPWITNNPNPPRMGAPVTFTAPVILEYRNSTWKFQPQQRITGNGADVATFGNDRAANAAPADVGGDLTISTFNVLNYFPTTGADHVAAGGTCGYFLDRDDNPIAVNTNPGCNTFAGGTGPRGAANAANLARQQEKIVTAINTLDADVVSLEEIENSVKMVGGQNRDAAVQTLVNALNTAAGETRWAFAPSPAAADLPTPAQEDVIRTAFIYQPASVEPVGASVVLKDEVNFDNAREPLAQAFKPLGGDASTAFGVIVNHFKSKGSSCGSGSDDALQGNCNGDRIGQAGALRDFAADFRTARGIDALFLVGDFNSYTFEDPMQVLDAAGYENIKSDDDTDASYSFSGLAGSLDHVLGNAAAVDMVTGSDIWEINANESLAYQYSRYNYHGELYHAATPWSSSDHNPEVIGIDVADGEPATRDIQILGTNDFHGRILNNAAGAPGSPTGTPQGANTSSDASAGAAILSGAVKQLRQQNPDTVFAAAGDLIGASTFESFILNDEPTIDALNAAGLEVSAAGNHEFDQGYEDLVGRVQTRAEWEYIAANIEEPNGRDDLAESWIKDFGDVRVGFVGAVTEDLPSLVSPDGIQGVTVTDIVTATNAEADALETAGADLIVLLAHEGAPNTNCLTMDDDPTSTFGSIVTGVSNKVDAIVSGHTHLAYNCSFPVDGKSVERPVVSAGQYGQNLNQLVFTVDTATGEVTAKTQALLPLKANPTTPNYPSDPAVEPIVNDAIVEAGPLGAVPVGKIAAPFSRAKFQGGTRENRGGESTLGNLVAEIQRWATSEPESGSAEIALMNPGGLRADLVGSGDPQSRDVTYREAANVQPFANELVNIDLTGAQLETVLEQQWQLSSAGTVPSRPFLKLGQSDGFEYTYTTSVLPTPNADDGAATYTQGEITSMALNSVPIEPATTYSVTVNSFLASGGDNFRELANGTNRQITGTDLQAQVDYFEQVVGDTPLEVDYSQRAVGVEFPEGDDVTYERGETVTFDLSSLIMTGVAGGVTDPKDDEVIVSLDGESLGTFPVDTTVPDPGTAAGQADAASTDESGKATVSVDLPADAPVGSQVLTVTGPVTGTEVDVPIEVTPPPIAAVDATISRARVVAGKDRAIVRVTVSPGESGPAVPTGEVEVRVGNRLLGTGTLENGQTAIRLPAPTPAGARTLSVRYLGDNENGAATDTVNVQVVKQNPVMVLKAPGSVRKGATPTVSVSLNATGVKVTGRVQFRFQGKTVVRSVKNEKVSLKLPKVNKRTVLFVKYLGNANLNSAVRGRTIKVKR